MNTKILAIIPVLLISLLFSCGKSDDLIKNPNPLSVIYEDNTMRVVEIPRLTEEQMKKVAIRLHTGFTPIREAAAYTSSDFIFTGTVSNVREIKITYLANDTNKFVYETLFDFTVDKVYHLKDTDKEINSGDTITVMHGYTSYNRDEMTPLICEGDEYLLFTMLTSTKMDAKKDKNYDLTLICDYFADNPRSLTIKKIDGLYETKNDFFKSYTENPEKRTEYSDIDGDESYTVYLHNPEAFIKAIEYKMEQYNKQAVPNP